MSAALPASAVHKLVPLLYVSDMNRSAAFYDNKLGFEITQHWSPEGKMLWCLLARGGAELMLQQADAEDGPAEGRGRGVMFFFHCDDADAMHAELLANGLKLDPPQVAFYGMKQLFLKDPDGYQLCFQNRVENREQS
ncbi:MAG TPA: VOC family protein [Pirellulales bacterium]|jgi:catechol 2,3-dioxygenase-like lactoylglutathione lyase family enzyme|nr:VOC family protein [Pirellulales bacterium]